MNEKLPSYGGQALIEGVLMRGSKGLAAAMRKPDGQIVVETEQLTGIYTNPFSKMPFLRGLVLLWDSLGIGMHFLTISANMQTGDDEKLEGPALYLTLTLSLAFGIGLFFMLPAALGHLAINFLHFNTWWSNVLEGVARLALAVGYIWAIGKMPDIARVFAYHGAEHKTINAFEAGAEMKPEIVSQYSLEHPRCGTAFLLTLIVLSIFIFALLGPMGGIWRYIVRLLLILPLASIAYELIKWSSNHRTNPLVELIVKPNLALQHLTTREPTLEMLEVSITAFTAMLEQENRIIEDTPNLVHETT
ncbi:MAG: DUF1385 domain-containing protein [Leptolinea sp.]|jgi:uncharacterized protein YqhQ|nr:DUF1385 domain-containing protein [Leptolinea sp.]